VSDWNVVGAGLWKALAEFDAEPASSEAEKTFRLALIGASGSGKSSLCSALAGDTSAGVPDVLRDSMVEYRLPLSAADIAGLEAATLLILLLDATKGSYAQEVAAADYLSYLGNPMLVCYNKMDLLPADTRLIRGQARWRGTEIMPLSATQAATVEELLVPAVLEVLPDYALSLARHLPLFRQRVTARVIHRAAVVNATYASASGLSGRFSLFRVPFSDDDVDVLSANAAGMVCRLALGHGLPEDWHHAASNVGVVVEPGRLWQEMARHTVGFLPLWNRQSKVSVAYGGTVVLGRAIQRWCETGQALTAQALHAVCGDAAAESRNISRELVAKAREVVPVTAKKQTQPGRGTLRSLTPRLPGRRVRPTCPSCGRKSPADAAFCAYCGKPLVSQPVDQPGTAETRREGGA
jgi:energy-coupling factor transporter ATP-binding protein EcfA2